MATNKSQQTRSQGDLEKEVAALKEDMARLRQDILDLTRALGDNAAGLKEQAQEELLAKAEALHDQAQEQLEKIQAAGRQAVGEMERQIVQRPFASLLTAAGIGFILAKLLDGGERR